MANKTQGNASGATAEKAVLGSRGLRENCHSINVGFIGTSMDGLQTPPCLRNQIWRSIMSESLQEGRKTRSPPCCISGGNFQAVF